MGGKRVPRLRGPKARSPYLEIFFTNARKKNKCTVYTSLNKWIVFVSHCFEQTFINVSNWKLPLHLRFSYLPIFKCRRRTHCEKFGAATFWFWFENSWIRSNSQTTSLNLNWKQIKNQIYRVYTENKDFNGYKVRFWHEKTLYAKNIIVIE